MVGCLFLARLNSVRHLDLYLQDSLSDGGAVILKARGRQESLTVTSVG